MLSDGFVRFHPLDAEELENADFADLSPVVAVRGERDVAEIVGEFSDAVALRPVAAVEIVGLEERARGVGGGYYCGLDAAEGEAHDGAVALGEAPQRFVGEIPELVQVSNYRKLWGAWRKTTPFSS